VTIRTSLIENSGRSDWAPSKRGSSVAGIVWHYAHSPDSVFRQE
jgi:hypothetical protein